MCSELIETERDVMNEVNGKKKKINFPLGQEEPLDPITLTLYSISSSHTVDFIETHSIINCSRTGPVLSHIFFKQQLVIISVPRVYSMI